MTLDEFMEIYEHSVQKNTMNYRKLYEEKQQRESQGKSEAPSDPFL